MGESKHPELSYHLTTQLLTRLELRGRDATGFWGANRDGHIRYHKEPIRSSRFVKTAIWEELIDFNANLLLAHARQASHGEAKVNKNNHPFVSDDRLLGLIHNGKLPEYHYLRNQFDIRSDCDSEVLLRIIESGSDRLEGVEGVFSSITIGHMAVALGEVKDDRRLLWLFRNKHRSLWLIDLRDNLGQIFFCSTPELWRDTLNDCDVVFRRQKLMEIPAQEVWAFEITDTKKCVTEVNRYKVTHLDSEENYQKETEVDSPHDEAQGVSGVEWQS